VAARSRESHLPQSQRLGTSARASKEAGTRVNVLYGSTRTKVPSRGNGLPYQKIYPASTDDEAENSRVIPRSEGTARTSSRVEPGARATIVHRPHSSTEEPRANQRHCAYAVVDYGRLHDELRRIGSSAATPSRSRPAAAHRRSAAGSVVGALSLPATKVAIQTCRAHARAGPPARHQSSQMLESRSRCSAPSPGWSFRGGKRERGLGAVATKGGVQSAAPRAAAPDRETGRD
jgi:hypothetical protein